MEYHSAVRKNELSPFASVWMELEGIYRAKRDQSEKDKCHVISLIHKFKKQNRNTEDGKEKYNQGDEPCEILNHRKHTEGCWKGRWVGGVTGWGTGGMACGRARGGTSTGCCVQPPSPRVLPLRRTMRCVLT